MAVAPGLPSVANPQRPSDGTGGQDIRPLARVHDGLPGIHVGDARLAAFHPEHHLYIRRIIALRQSVQRACGKWLRMRSSEEVDAVTQSAYDVRRETRVSVLAPCSASLGTPEF
ncbi:two-component histidine kinase [Streptomyces lydicamycinicus]|uniref:Two-component histidine kinase n=1 Tax=Streptomyces lydicamycinicus TaxID=1546107 RepID=A0A0P4RH89_9ACTN|nr:two-component histidine kinase [Streptomyces lydicamycinicus]